MSKEALDNLTPDQIEKFNKVVKGCVQLKERITMDTESLREEVKALAEEMMVKPTMINKIITDIHKGKVAEKSEENDIYEHLMSLIKTGLIYN